MTQDFLSPDEIERLFQRASEGNLPVETDRTQTGGRRARWLRTVDFTRPTKFTTDQERRLKRLLDGFCATGAQRVMAEHRLPIELEVIDVQQLTWSNAFRALPDNVAYCTIETAPHDARMLLAAELPLLITAIEGLCGGDPREQIPTRELTDIDLILVRRLVRTLVETLGGIWYDHAEIRLELGDATVVPETLQVAPGSEPTLAITMEARLHRVNSTVALLVPYSAIAPAANAFSQRDEDHPPAAPAAARAVRAGLERVELTLRAEVGDTVLTLEEILALKPGELVRLDAVAGDEVTLYADRTQVHRGRAGRSGGRRAVQVTRPAEVPE